MVKLSVGSIVHNEITNQTGRIVRVPTGIRRPGYIVVTADRGTGKEIEALWPPRELKEVRDRARQIATALSIKHPDRQSREMK